MEALRNGGDLVRQSLNCKDGLLATLIQRADSGPIRPIATGRRSRPVGMFPSVKCGRAQPWESRCELHAFHHAEVNSEVVAYRAQPHTLEMSEHGQLFRYTPDLELTLSTDAVEIVEIKGAYDPSADAWYEHKLALASEIYRSQGWSFRVVGADELVAEPRFSAVQEIQSYRRASLTPADTALLSTLFRGRDQIAFGELASAYPTPLVGKAKASAMMVRRMIDIDYSRGLNDQAAVRLVSRKEATGG